MFRHLLTQAAQTCSSNGQPASCQAVDHAFAAFGIFFIFLWFIILALSTLNLVFWIISIIHLVQHDDVHDRIMWLVLVLLVPFAAWVYFFGPKRVHDHAHSTGQLPPHPQYPYSNTYAQNGNYQHQGYPPQTPPTSTPDHQEHPSHNPHHPHKPKDN